jgi:hypothetical protein
MQMKFYFMLSSHSLILPHFHHTPKVWSAVIYYDQKGTDRFLDVSEGFRTEYQSPGPRAAQPAHRYRGRLVFYRDQGGKKYPALAQHADLSDLDMIRFETHHSIQASTPVCRY